METTQSGNNIKRALFRELRRVWHNPRYVIILTLGIAITFTFFATVTHEGQPKRLPVAVVDLDGTFLSRRICHEINATQGVEVVAVYNNHTEARKAMQRGEIYAFYEIPNGTYNSLLQFRSPHFVLYVNYAYMLAGTLSYKQLATMGMLATGAVQREVYRKKGFDDEQIMGLIQPVEYDTRTIGNPWINYGNYLMTALIPAVVAFIVLMHTSYLIARERQESSLKGWVSCAGGNAVHALIGKMLPYTAWYSFLLLLANLLMFGFMGFPLEGSWLLMVLNSILLVTASQSLGCFISGALPDAPLAMSVSAIFCAVSFSLSGFSFPVTSMLPVFSVLSNIYPIRHYFLNFCDIAIFGNGMSHCWARYATLIGFTVLMFVGALFIQWQLREESKAEAKLRKNM